MSDPTNTASLSDVRDVSYRRGPDGRHWVICNSERGYELVEQAIHQMAELQEGNLPGIRRRAFVGPDARKVAEWAAEAARRWDDPRPKFTGPGDF